MSYIVRRQTVGKAEELHSDLLENLAHPEHYGEDIDQYNADMELFIIINNWIRAERLIVQDEQENF